MIIVKTNNETHFVNEKLVKKVSHDKYNSRVFITREGEQMEMIDDVAAVTFVSDAQAMEFNDDGNIIEDMKAKMDQMEAEKLATIIKTESECNAKLERAEKELKEGRDWVANFRDEYYKFEAENDDLKKENEKLLNDVMKLRAKLRDFGCEL